MMIRLPLALVALWLCGCGRALGMPTTAAPATPTPGVRPHPPTPSVLTAAPATPKPSPTPIPEASVTPSCLDQGGRLETGQVDDDRLTRSLPFIVYLPPCYDVDTSTRYPVLYMLHGLAEDDHEWIDLGLTGSSDRLVHAGVIPPFLIVMPWEQTGQDMEVALTQVLVPTIDQRYRTLAEPAQRALGGLSRGGGWALHIGMRHLDQFGVIGLHSPAPFGVDLAMVPRWVERQEGVTPPKVWIDIGDRDTLLPSARQLTKLLDGMGQPYTFVLGSGWHDADYWSKNVGTYLRWYGAAW